MVTDVHKQVKQLILVYNADTNLLARIVDFQTKILRPDIYPCKLCMLTFGSLSMFPKWKRYLTERPEEIVELHRNEFRERFGSEWALPGIFLHTDSQLSPVLSADEINSVSTLDELMKRLDKILA